ncbi:hypothetical protein IJG71_03700 [Candidatus Saccharibacteria bacterium]|nr:hypothetical protein [Candidatus Saccharibacteria bacterium]
MSSQIKLSSYKGEGKEKIGQVLDLEKKYFDILWGLFTSEKFLNDLEIIEKEIQKQYDFLQLTWELKNKLKVPAERLVRQYVYKDLAHLVKHIYPSAVSSDCAFLTDDAVINIDIKTLDKDGNIGDIKNLQFENNQSSFENINLDIDPKILNSGVKVECLLPKEYSYNNEKPLPVLTYFFTVVYEDNRESFKLNRDDGLKTIYLKCLPNGFVSPLFNYDIVNNFKTYTYFGRNHGFPPVFLTDDRNKVEEKVKEFVENNPDFILINGRQKIGAFNIAQEHPKYGTKGVSWFPVSRKNGDKNDYYLEAVYKGNTSRLDNDKIEIRYDSEDNLWHGVKKFKL